MTIKRKHYTAAEKGKIALEAIRGNLTQTDASDRWEIYALSIMP